MLSLSWTWTLDAAAPQGRPAATGRHVRQLIEVRKVGDIDDGCPWALSLVDNTVTLVWGALILNPESRNWPISERTATGPATLAPPRTLKFDFISSQSLFRHIEIPCFHASFFCAAIGRPLCRIVRHATSFSRLTSQWFESRAGRFEGVQPWRAGPRSMRSWTRPCPGNWHAMQLIAWTKSERKGTVRTTSASPSAAESGRCCVAWQVSRSLRVVPVPGSVIPSMRPSGEACRHCKHRPGPLHPDTVQLS